MIEIAEKLVEIGAVKITTPDNLFTWVSGIKSPIYCDNRLVMSYPEIRKMVAKRFAEMIKEQYPDTEIIAGTATAGIPHAAFTAEILELPMVYVRSASKGHGTKKLVEGNMPAGSKVLLIEDLLSTGKSSVAALKALRSEGAEVSACMAIFNYGFEDVEKAFKEVRADYYSLTTYSEVLGVAEKSGALASEQVELLSKWSKNPRIFTDAE